MDALTEGTAHNYFSLYQKVYELLDKHPVSDKDCGEYCGKACCCYTVPHDTEAGMELLPGEEEIFPLESEWLKPRFLPGSLYDYPPEWGTHTGCIQIRCLRPCPRGERPANCRLFPLSVYGEEDNYYLIVAEGLTEYSCQLINHPELINPEFIKSAGEAAFLLLGIPKFRQLVDWDSQQIDSSSIRMKLLLDYPG